MKYCCCIGLEALNRLEILHAHGYTCYETGFSALQKAPEEKILALRDKAAELGMTCVSHNGMFPAEVPLLRGPEGYDDVRAYLEETFEKAKPLGSPVVVLGSGKAREIPEGMTKEEAFDRFAALLRDVVGPMAAERGITIAIEELRRQECNFINNCREAMELIRAVNHPSIKLLIDYFHSMLGGDKLEELASYGDAIAHVHIASPKNDRRYPNINDLADCRGFFAALKSAGYDGPISLEGSDGGNFESAIAEAISVMKEAENG